MLFNVRSRISQIGKGGEGKGEEERERGCEIIRAQSLCSSFEGGYEYFSQNIAVPIIYSV